MVKENRKINFRFFIIKLIYFYNYDIFTGYFFKHIMGIIRLICRNALSLATFMRVYNRRVIKMNRIEIYLNYLIDDVNDAKRTLALQKIFNQIKKQ